MIDAAAQGAGDGLQLALNIGGMLIAFLALIAMVQRHARLAAQRCRAWAGCRGRCRASSASVFAPVAWMLGVPWKDCATIGDLLGTRLVLNEFVAFLELGPTEGDTSIRGRSRSRPMRCAGLRISVRLRFRSAASARWRRRARSDLARLGLARRGGRIHGELHVGLHRRHAAVAMFQQTKKYIPKRHAGVRRRSAVVLGQRTRRVRRRADESRVEIPYAEIPGWPQFDRGRTCRQAGLRQVWAVSMWR